MQKTIRLARRSLVQAACGAWALHTMGVRAAPSDGYPNRPLKIVVPVPPGGTLDTQARAIGAQLTETLKQPVVVESRPGAGGTIGTNYVAKSPADGYTLLLVLRSLVISPSVIANLPFDPIRDFAPIALVESTYWVFCATPSLPVNTVKEMVELAKTRPGGLNYAGTGIGGDNHLTMEQFRNATGAPMTQIPYSGGGPAVVAMLSGAVDVMLVPGVLAIPHIKSGKLKPLAVLGSTRAPIIPDVPTMTEAGVPGFEDAGWTGLFAPAGTPASIVALLHGEVQAILDRNRRDSRLFIEGIQVPGSSTPEELATMMRQDVVKWRRIAESVGIKPA